MKIYRLKTRRGFTLLEIIVSLFLFGLVVSAVYSTWMAIIRGSKSGLDATAAVQRSRMAVRTVETALTCSRSFAADLQNYTFLAENGSQPSLSFVACLPDAFPRDGKFMGYHVRRVTFALEPGPGPNSGNRFVLRQNPILMDLDSDEKEHPVVLARNVKRFEMEFWDKKEQEWTDEWTETNQLPLKVKIVLEFMGKDAHSLVKDETTRIISLPSVMVQGAWQMPGYNGRSGLGNGAPNTVRPGQIVPGGQP